jgi:hypothetical protein
MKRALIGALPGIDDSASMLLPLRYNPAISCNNAQSNAGGRASAGDGWLVTRKQWQILFRWNGTTRRHSPPEVQCYRNAGRRNKCRKGQRKTGLAILMLACFARKMDVFCSLRKDGKRGDFNGRV